MRENIGSFRGLDRTSEKLKWVHGGLVIMCDPHSGANDTYEIVDETGRFTQVVPSSVGECTGLEDSTGQMIFENDIVSVEGVSGTMTLYVAFEDGEFVLRHLTYEHYRAALRIACKGQYRCKVVGFVDNGTEFYGL